MNKFVFLFSLNPKASAKNSSCRIIKYDSNFNILSLTRLNFELYYVDVHKDELFLLGSSSNKKSKHVYVYNEHFSLLRDKQLENSEGLPFYVPISVTKMRVTEKYLVFLDGKKVLLMDRLDGMIKRTFCIGSGDFVLDSSNERILAYDGKTGKLVCFDFEGKSFEISLPMLKNYEMVDRFMFYDENSHDLQF